MSGSGDAKYTLPSSTVLAHASKLAIVEDKPIMMDYWTDSLDKKALIGVRDTGEKLLDAAVPAKGVGHHHSAQTCRPYPKIGFVKEEAFALLDKLLRGGPVQ